MKGECKKIKTLYNLQEYEFSKGVNIIAEEKVIRNLRSI